MQAYPPAEWSAEGEIGKFPAMSEPDREPTSVEEVAARLKLTREALKLSQAALCRQTGISTQSWNNAETADNRISVDEAMKFCRATGVTLDWVFRGNRSLLPAMVLEELVRRERQATRESA